LGIGNNPVVASSNKPQLIVSLRGLAFTQIAAGGNSSFALTVSGALFGWGRNKYESYFAVSCWRSTLKLLFGSFFLKFCIKILTELFCVF
jgi:hypothetical protein